MNSGKIQRIITSVFGVKEYIKQAAKPLTWEDAASAEFSEDVIRACQWPRMQTIILPSRCQKVQPPKGRSLDSVKCCEDQNLLYKQQQAQINNFLSCLWE